MVVVVREQERAVRYCMRFIYIHGNHHVTKRPAGDESNGLTFTNTWAVRFSPFQTVAVAIHGEAAELSDCDPWRRYRDQRRTPHGYVDVCAVSRCEDSGSWGRAIDIERQSEYGNDTLVS